MKLALDVIQRERQESFRLIHDHATGEQVLERLEQNGWFAIYSFDSYPLVAGDIDAANFLSAVWAERSPFPRNLMLNIRTAGGRASLFNLSATAVDAEGKATHWTLGSQFELRSILKDLFALDIGNAATTELWQRLEARLVDKAA